MRLPGLVCSREISKRNFTFGGPVAEHDPLLLQAYVDNGTYEAIKSRTDPACFVIGRTGSGKSAAFRLLEYECQDKVIRIAPENLALTYITNLQVMPRLVELGVHLEPFLKALWKHVFIVEILRHRYNIRSPEQKQNIVMQWLERWKGDPGKVEAIKYLSEFGDKFWCETDERVKQIAVTFEQKFAAAGGAHASAVALGANSTGSMEQVERKETRVELVQRYQRIVNEVQIPRLNKMMELLSREILDKQHFTYIVIDDLDKDWVDERFANLLIRCLFQAVIDMKGVENLKILVALRTNIFQQLNYGELRHGEQEEKLRSYSLPLQWEPRDLRKLLAKRAEVASITLEIDPPLTLDQILPKTTKKAPDPMKYILSRTLMRPRDAILFLNECLREAIGNDNVTMDNIYQAERKYSEERLIALRDEWKDPYLDIDKVFEQFRRASNRLSRAALTDILNKVAELLGDRGFRGEEWLEPICRAIWESGSDRRTWTENYGRLLELLYTVGFLGVVRGKQAVYSYDDARLLASLGNVYENVQSEIHPAFYQALNIAYTAESA